MLCRRLNYGAPVLRNHLRREGDRAGTSSLAATCARSSFICRRIGSLLIIRASLRLFFIESILLIIRVSSIRPSYIRFSFIRFSFIRSSGIRFSFIRFSRPRASLSVLRTPCFAGAVFNRVDGPKGAKKAPVYRGADSLI